MNEGASVFDEKPRICGNGEGSKQCSLSLTASSTIFFANSERIPPQSRPELSARCPLNHLEPHKAVFFGTRYPMAFYVA